MALENARVSATADAVADVSSQMATLLHTLKQLLTFNSNNSIGWTTDPKPDYIDENAAGNLTGKQYSRADVSNAIFSLDQVNRCLTNQTITTGDHLGNLNKLARPLG